MGVFGFFFLFEATTPSWVVPEAQIGWRVIKVIWDMGLLNNSLQHPIKAPDEPRIVSGRECSKKFLQQGRSHFDERSVLIVREHGKRATCLREAASAGMEPLACQP